MRRCVFLLPLLAIGVMPSPAYSVLTHEAIVDLVWQSDIRPMLLARFPATTPEQLHEAHAYVYGGCLGQDMGYAPFSSKLWSDLAHYVRSGDLVATMLRDSRDIDEYAYALGALAHYVADKTGHPFINKITAISNPKLRRRFGDIVTYEDDPGAHLKTEFALDVIQVSRATYAPDAYHDFVGFEVAQSLLERSFRDTYGLEFKDLFLSEDLAIGTYRFAVSKLIPEMTKTAWHSRRKDIENLSPSVTRSRYVFSLPRRRYEKEWGKKYQKPGIGARILAFTFKIVPTFGPFNALKFRPITAQGEQLFLTSFNMTVDQYRAALGQVRTGKLALTDANLDTGDLSEPGIYRKADEAYVQLLDKLSSKHFQALTPALRTNILAHFAGANQPETVRAEIEQLKAAAVETSASKSAESEHQKN